MPLTNLSLRNSTWMDGVQVSAQDLRLQQSGAFLTGASPSGSTGIAARPGLRYGTGDGLKIGTSSGMTLAVNAGVAWVQGSAAANSGMYEGVLDTAGTVTLATSDPTNPRIDNIIVQFTDLGTSSSTAIVTPQTGTPAASPVAPTLPANSLLLAQVSVGAGVSSISSGNIADKRVWTVATGGIVPMTNVTGGITGQAGLYAHDLSSGRLKVSDGSGNARAPKTGAFTPAIQRVGSNVTVNGTLATLATVSVTVDGATEVEVRAGYRNITPISAAVGDSLFFAINMDGTTFPDANGGWFYRQDSSSTNAGQGMSFVAWGTPSSGSHTFTLTGLVSPGSGSYNCGIPFLRVGPSFA